MADLNKDMRPGVEDGHLASGGSPAVGSGGTSDSGAGGAVGTGGFVATGGRMNVAGAIGSGGMVASGGRNATGGGGSGGTTGNTGGSSAGGGMTGIGGMTRTGGASSTGGMPGTGGMPSTGGSIGTDGAGTGGAGTGGAGTGGAGTGGCTNLCATGETQCLSGATLQTCAAAANGCAAFSSSTCSTGLVCERVAPAACSNPNWAEWPVSNGAADVSAGAPNPATFTINGDGTVTDNVTRLMWQQTVPTLTYAQTAAVAYCPTLTLAGHNDWRLPSIIELASLIDFSATGVSIDGRPFPGTPAASFWSSSPLIGALGAAVFSVNFADGSTTVQGNGVADNVRCVR